MTEGFAPTDGPVAFAQSKPYAIAAAACGARVFDLDLGVGHAQVVQRGRLRLMSRGPVWTGTPEMVERRQALRRSARWCGITLVTPQEPVVGLGLIPLVTPMHHAIWDLAGDLRSRMDRKWRNHLAAAERASFDFALNRDGALEALIAREVEQRAVRGYQTLQPEFTRALPKAALRVWDWRVAGEVGAAMCFVRHGASATYHLAWAGQAARGGAVHGLMLWRAALALRAEGVRWLDLGSINTEQAPGLARFKLGTGAAVHRFGPTMLVLPG